MHGGMSTLDGGMARKPVIAAGEPSPPLTGLVARYRADLGVTEALGIVSAWADQSGNGYDLAQSSALNRPTLVTGVINGQPVIRFARVASQFLDRATTPSQAQPWTVTAVVSAVAGSVDAALFDDGAGGNFRQVVLEENGVSDWRISLFAGSGLTGDADSQVTGGAFAWLELVFNGASSDIRVANVSATTGDAGSGGLTGIRLGMRHNDDLPLDGDIAELMVHAKVLDGDERTAMAAYILAQYGI